MLRDVLDRAALARRHDACRSRERAPRHAPAASAWRRWWPLPLALLVAARRVRRILAVVDRAVRGARWRTRTRSCSCRRRRRAGRVPSDAAGRWRPLYRGGLRRAAGACTGTPRATRWMSSSRSTGLARPLGAEMISYSNVDLRRGAQQPGMRRRDASCRCRTADARGARAGRRRRRRRAPRLALVHGRRAAGGRVRSRSRRSRRWRSSRAVRDSERIVTLSHAARRRCARSDCEAFVAAHGALRRCGFRGRGLRRMSDGGAAADRPRHLSARLRRARERRSSTSSTACRPTATGTPSSASPGSTPSSASASSAPTSRSISLDKQPGQGSRRLRAHVARAAPAAARRSSTRATSARWTCSGSPPPPACRTACMASTAGRRPIPKGLDPKGLRIRRACRPVIHRYVPMSQDIARWLERDVGVHAGRASGSSTAAWTPSASARRPRPADCRWERSRRGTLVPSAPSAASTRSRTRLAAARPSRDPRPRPISPGLRLIDRRRRPAAATLEAQAATLGLADQVRFTGARSDTPDLMRSFDVFVLPSINEGISNTILEAMATGLPVVAGRVGGNPELVVDGVTGAPVRSRRPGGLEQALLPYLTDPALRQAHGAAGRARVVQNFSLDAMVAALPGPLRRTSDRRSPAMPARGPR